MAFVRIISLYLLFVLVFQSASTIAGQTNNNSPKQSIIHAIGGINTWKNTRYFLYTASGNNISQQLGKARKFLFDKESGLVRYEGQNANNQSVILLFNIKTVKANKCAINGQEQEVDEDLFSDVIKQFVEDTNLLFLPALVNSERTQVSSPQQKIVDAEKTHIFTFKGSSLFSNKSLNGSININDKGHVKQFTNSEVDYMVGQYKDIGGGLHLPTSFLDSSDQSNTCIFNIVAAFTEMESSKLTEI